MSQIACQTVEDWEKQGNHKTQWICACSDTCPGVASMELHYTGGHGSLRRGKPCF